MHAPAHTIKSAMICSVIHIIKKKKTLNSYHEVKECLEYSRICIEYYYSGHHARQSPSYYSHLVQSPSGKAPYIPYLSHLSITATDYIDPW